MARESEVTRLHDIGGRTVKVISTQTFSFKEYNQNRFLLVDKEAHMEIPGYAEEMSLKEKGHYYICTQIADSVWEVRTPYRYADGETAKLFSEITPEPCDDALLKKFGHNARRWQAVTDQFRINSAYLPILEERLRYFGGVVNKVTYDRVVAGALVDMMQTQLDLIKAEQKMTLDISVTPEMLAYTASSIETRIKDIDKSADNLTRHTTLADTGFAPAEDRTEMQLLGDKGNGIIEQAGKLLDVVKDLYRSKLEQSVIEATSQAPQTVADILGEAAKIMPALKHLMLDGKDVYIEKGDLIIRITEDGVDVETRKSEEEPDKTGANIELY